MLGKAYLFKVPAKAMKNMLVKWGYVLGSNKKDAVITLESIKRDRCTYLLMASPRKRGKQLEC